MSEDLISVIDAANKLGIQKQQLFKIIKRLRIATSKQKSSAHRGQAVSYLSYRDFELIANDQASSNNQGNSKDKPIKASELDCGVFYLIQLEPECDPGRFKLGFASNMPERLRQHRCSAPYAKVIQTWPCHVLWEKTTIDSVTQGCEKIHTEVFRNENTTDIQERCEKFFALMPHPNEIMR